MTVSGLPAIKFLQSVGSTNTYLLERTGLHRPFQGVATLNQTAGRGRQGRSWESPFGLGLALSVALPVLARVTNAGLYSLLVGSAVLGFVRGQGLLHAQMKWPNDILLRGRKIAGILCEMAPAGIVVGGIGINLYHQRHQLPLEDSTSLAIEGVRVADAEKFARELVRTLNEFWAATASSNVGWSSILSPSVATLGRRVVIVESRHRCWEGVAEGLDDDGHLLVRSLEDGLVKTVVAADVLHLRQ